jgi:anti-anti-sigma regulatory factor
VKIALSQERGVDILSVTGTVVVHDAKVLRAGISKIFRTGRNKIVIELSASQDVSLDALREIAAFDALARELSGRIVLAGVSPAVKTKIDSFAQPPLIVCFASRKEAVDFIIKPPVPVKADAPLRAPAPAVAHVPAPAAPAAQPSSPFAGLPGYQAPGAPLAPGDPAGAATHAHIPHNEYAEMKSRVTDLERENQALREQVMLTTLERRVPANEQVYEERIRFLESKVEKLLIEAAKAPAAGAAGAGKK